MTDVAAAAVAPTSAPSDATSTPTTPSVDTPSAAPQAKAARIELAKMDPSTIVSLIVDGQETEMTAAEAFKRLGRSESSNRKFQEAAADRKAAAAERAELEAFVDRFAGSLASPAELRAEMRSLGLDPRQVAQAMLDMEDQDARLSPEQRRIREYEERERQTIEAQRQAEAKQAQEERTHYREQYRKGFDDVMTAEGIPDGHVSRAILLPTLARAAAYIMEHEGREMTRGDARRVIQASLDGIGGLRSTPREITDADVEAYMERKRTVSPESAPQIDRKRGTDGKFVSTGTVSTVSLNSSTNINGERLVNNLSNVWGNRF